MTAQPQPFDFDRVCDRRSTNSVKWDECPQPDILPLWVADMDFPTAPCVQDAVMRRAAHGCYGYTLVPDAYYESIVRWFSTRHGWDIDRTDILYTIGVVPAIAAILKAVCQTGDNVVLLTPVYNCFYNLVRNAGCQALEVALIPDYADGSITYTIDWDALSRALSHEKSTVLLFCNPHNPVGRVWSEDELERVARLCYRHGITLISDEIHNELTAPGVMYNPMGRVVQRLSSAYAFPRPLRYCVCTSPSKSFNIAGLQNANIICPDDDLRRRIDRAVNLNETCDVNPFGVEAVMAAYNEGSEWLDSLRAYIYANYDYACEYLRRQCPSVSIAEMKGTYLMWVDVREAMQRHGVSQVGEFCRRLMIDARVWLCAGSIYGRDGEGFVRINLACPRQTLTEALSRLAAYIGR
ncbi:MAG: pyridoxal phosphate-dependent aminotransferase [Bacteroidales bacterium]|nr:pyridoxal phosphate-dependent aminotransferase [Candidatus Liminaster caballi]